MSATPEELLGQGRFLADPEPFSPSIFLDLPPTPRPDGDGEDPAPSDDLVLPFISRMLMEEDIGDKFFYQYPDHPALLTAQDSFAKILSDGGTKAFSSDAATTSSGSDSATTNTDGGGAFTLSPSSYSDAPAFANATWPYDPLELSQLLDSMPAQNGGSAGFHQSTAEASVQSSAFLDGAEEANTLTAGDGEHGALSSTFFSGQNKVNMDMLNLAFLKGMEEATKFLPTSNSLLIDLEATSGEQVKKKGMVDGMPMFQESGNGRGHKNRHNWDDLEAERKSKVMVPEPEETGEMVDKLIIDGYAMCLDKMKGLCITTGSEAEKNTRKGKGKLAHGRQSLNEAVDLRTLLIHCAQALSMDDRRSATELLRQIKQHSSPRGDANQRLAHCFAQGLEARLAGTGSQVYKSLMTKCTSLVEFLKAHQLYLAACCFKMTAFRFSNLTICKAIAGRKKVHIVEYGMQHGFQWPSLLAFFATWEAPPEVRITGIDLPQPGFRPAARIEETGRRLSNLACQLGVPFKFQSIAAKWDTVRVDDINIGPDEVLAVNSIIQFGSLTDEGVDIHSPSPRDVVLSNIREMHPDVFILCVVNGSYSSPFFVTRFREALFYYSAMFDMLDATAPRDSDQRLLVERDIFGRCALNVIACEEADRVERPEAYKQWQVRNRRAGLRQLPLYPDIVKILREKVKNQYHRDFVIDVDHQWFLQGWKGRILYAISTFVADESISEL